MAKKYNVQLQCPICKNPIIVSYEKYKPFKNSPVSDVRLNIEVGCSHISPGSVKPYIDLGLELKQMQENRRIDYQDLEDKEHREKMRKILENYDPDDEYNPSRF